MNYNESRESVGVLENMVRQYEDSKGMEICLNINCADCPFAPSCSSWYNKERLYEVAKQRLAILKGNRTEVRVGDRVWDIRYGWGNVVNREDNEDYPISVKFDSGDGDRYTKDGYCMIHDKNRSLFFQEIPIPPEALYTTQKPPIKITKKEVAFKLGVDVDRLEIIECLVGER